MQFRKGIRLILLCVVLAFPLRAADSWIPDPSDPPMLVNDFASAFTAAQRDSLETALVEFDDSTSNQICVVTVKDLQGMDAADYALALGRKWGVGSKRNNGVIVLLKTREGSYVDVTIQVGRGLEGAIPDVYASRIIRNIMGPHLRNDEYWPAVSKACIELMALARGEISEPRDSAEDSGEGAMVVLGVFFVIIFLLILLAASKDKNNRGGSGGGFFNGPTITHVPSSRSSHGSSWGGGFGGGSGWGGGFGGFGGGSFGGGGASGRF